MRLPMRSPVSRHGSERGSASVEAAIAVPAFALFVGLIIFGGRTTVAHQAVESAAVDAARSASLARTRSTAETAATTAAASSLANQDVACVRVTVQVDTDAFTAAVGQNAAVHVTVGCLLDLEDLAVPGVPGKRTVEARASSSLDTWRERS
jgi:Flp pilus assembly protein TadG